LFAAFWPRWKLTIYVTTALAFAWWKSPASQAFIDAWNSTTVYGIARVVDPTDLVALVALPIAFIYMSRVEARPHDPVHRVAMPIVVVVAAFAFTATSYEGKTYDLTPNDPRTTYQLNFPISDLPERLDETGMWYSRPAPSGDFFMLLDETCRTATFQAFERSTSTVISLVHLEPDVNCTRDGKRAQINVFEDQVVARLAGDREPHRTSRRPTGDRYEYSDDGRFRLPLTLSAAELRNRMTQSPELHRWQDGVYTAHLGWGYYARFSALETDPGVALEVIEYVNAWFRDRDETLEDLEERFTLFIELVVLAGPAN
jgi:hypothetical protein